ncbi:MAG TPA: hypothetical protein VK611_28400 [Acidimicrobiales bacterium]|nr:hypothetical protein [Acidimicrobiales bacterium]
MKLPLTTARLGLVAAGLLGTAGAVALTTTGSGADDPPATSFQPASSDDGPGDISGPCDEAEHAGDPRCTGVTTPTAPTTTPSTAPSPAPAPAPASSGSHTIPTAGGTVAYTVDGATLHLASAMPAAGWSVEVEQSSGREIELDFRSGSQRVQVNVELEGGQARERVRLRDDADGTDVRVEDGVVDHDRLDDHGGDDNSGSGSGSDDHGGDDSSGHGSDD